jgi:hypothetical protein
MNSLEKARSHGKVNREVVSSLYKNGPLVAVKSNLKVFKGGREIAKPVYVEAHQAVEYSSPVNHMVYSAANFSSSIFSSSNGRIEIKIDRQSAEKAIGFKFRIRLSESGGSNSITVVPIPYLFDRIEFWAEAGSGDQISNHYADTMFWLYNVFADEQNFVLMQNIGSSQKWQNNVSIAAGKSVDYYLELPGSWVEIVKPFIGNFKGDILCRLYTRNGVTASGSGTLALSQLDLILEHDDLSESDKSLHIQQYENNVLRHTYLDIIHISETKTCTASSETKFSLENLVGKCAFMLFCLRSSTSSTSNAITNYADIGDTCQVDILGPQNQKLLGHGTPIYGKELKSFMSKHFPGSLAKYKNVYLIPFCHNAMKAFTHTDGYMYFHGENYNLSLTFPAAGTSEVQTITLTNPANDGGYYQLAYKGYITDSLAYNANAAAIKAALEALPSIIDDGLTVTASGAATATFTLTFSPAKQVAYSNGHNANLVKIIPTSLNDGGVFEIGATTVTTVGAAGFTTGTYQLDLYAFVYRDFFCDGGRVKIME